MRRLLLIPGANTMIKESFKGISISSTLTCCSFHSTVPNAWILRLHTNILRWQRHCRKHYPPGIYSKNRSRVNVYKGRNKQLSQMPKCLKHESATCIFITKTDWNFNRLQKQKGTKKISLSSPLCHFLHQVSLINTAQSTLKRCPCWEPVPIHCLLHGN